MSSANERAVENIFCFHVVSRKAFTSVSINVPYFKPCEDWLNLFSGNSSI